ncbi:23S rRNA (adenine(2030)-N(6))-methyltransferase RlmJ [Thalassovita taeanensis]|uniref:Ribosomal RNA large subunit methyltransferase J n=1 Tax=Thalassovita taeanensis TaxID=657014 RepID=A0A1H9DC08_9RHOB|nr:23S rRNA (adenine(2030)-N(6))-methyltransferase RlmJ [Thalassovita taeanensis]SEQ10889.1 23S rRNA (adenine2030-N6)-methyltransferase [Thalassovita taeanensis]
MLSYQHIYHAGNLADVQKHALLCRMLSYMTVKDKPLSYLETHAGRGLYFLDADEAVKTGEAAAGINAIQGLGWFAPDHPYMMALSAVRAAHGAQAYPGSPLLAAQILRPQDRLHLAELHPREFAALELAMSPYPARVLRQDGFAMAMALTPPTPRRGLMLIDPSYEVKTDYDSIPGVITKLHRKWNVGVIALWYPILTSGAHKPMLSTLEAQGLPGVLRHEVRFGPARAGHRMVGSGMFIVNAPFGTAEEAARLTALFA